MLLFLFIYFLIIWAGVGNSCLHERQGMSYFEKATGKELPRDTKDVVTYSSEEILQNATVTSLMSPGKKPKSGGTPAK